MRDMATWAMVAAAVKDNVLGIKRQWLDVAHLTLTVSIAVFIWSQYQRFSDDNNALENKVLALEQQVQSMKYVEDQRHIGVNARMDEIDKRLDVHRQDLRALQDITTRHIENGNGRNGGGR